MNEKSAQENYKRFKLKQSKKNESFILSIVQASLRATVEMALNEIFKDFKTK